MLSDEELVANQQACKALLDSRKSLILSTLTPDGWPDISTVPFVRDEQGDIYIFISRLAAHTTNLYHNPCCSVLFVADEQSTRNVFARERITLRCKAARRAASEEGYDTVLQYLEQRQGKTVELLRTLPDFELYQLSPQQGSYVAGFGKAFDLELPGLVVTPR